VFTVDEEVLEEVIVLFLFFLRSFLENPMFTVAWRGWLGMKVPLLYPCSLLLLFPNRRERGRLHPGWMAGKGRADKWM